MSVLSNPAYDGHEEVTFVSEPAANLRAIIAIHSTRLGPGLGGCRRWHYDNEDAALTDVLRLSKGMSYKNALAGLPFGGAKAVILDNGGTVDAETLFEAFGRAVNRLGGRYITAEDVGTHLADVEAIARATRFVTGLHPSGELGGDPAPFTALGVYYGIRESARAVFGGENLDGISVAVQGLGGVGYQLCKLLNDAGATLVVADLDPQRTRRVVDEFGARAVQPDVIFAEPVDVFAPCALGGVINIATVAQLRAKIVAGSANNQLLTDADGARLRARGILYAPDYVINAGGVISVGAEYLGTMSESDVRAKITHIRGTLAEIYTRADAEDVPTNVVADRLARSRLRRSADLEAVASGKHTTT